MPVVSVITPMFNCEEFLSLTIAAVQRQTFQSWEMILVDDCSSDSSCELAKSFSEKDDRVRLIRLPNNSGAAVARNTAIEAAKGRYIAFLDSDDLWLPNKLDVQIAWMQENDYPFTFSSYEKIDETGSPFGRIGVPSRVDYKRLLKGCEIGCLTAIYDTEKLGKVYMPLIRKRQDWGLWLRLLKQTPYAYGFPDVLAQYRVTRNSLSASKRSAAHYAWRLLREVEQLSVAKSAYCFLHYAARGTLRTHCPGLARKLGVLV